MTRSRPLILRFLSRVSIGGVQNGLIETLSRADRDRYDFAVLCYKKKGEWAPRIEALGIPVHARKALPVWDPYQIARLALTIRRLRPDLVHISMAPSVIVGATAARLAGVRHVVVQHNNLYDRHWDAQNPFLNRWEWAMTRRASAILAVSRSVARCTEARLGLEPGRVLAIPNGIDLERFDGAPRTDLRSELGLSPETPLVGQVSRFLEVKRIEDFIEAAAILGREGGTIAGRPAPVFVVIGSGPAHLGDEYRRLAAAASPHADIRFLGGRHDLPSILPGLDVAVLPSLIEGCPNAILEYMAARTPIVATAIPPIEELVDDGKDALLVPTLRPDRIAESIRRLLEERDLAARLTASARARVEARDWRDTQRAYERVYDRLLSGRDRGGVSSHRERDRSGRPPAPEHGASPSEHGIIRVAAPPDGSSRDPTRSAASALRTIAPRLMQFPTDLRYKGRVEKARYVWTKYQSILRGKNILDVGADERHLATHLDPAASYYGIGLGGSPDRVVDLETERVPFPDASFDAVICLDVLEHVENTHEIFDELCRVTREHVILSLPNSWEDFWKCVTIREYRPGRALKYYGLPPERPEDRHKWFFSASEARAFVRARAERNGMDVVQIDHSPGMRARGGISGLLDRWSARRLLREDLDFDDLVAGTMWAVLAKRGAR